MDFNKLNSMTKYPEIKTYHKMGNRGRLQPELSVTLDPDRIYHVSEKIDGTNTRKIFINSSYCDYVIGSREELLHAEGDRIINPSLDIVDNSLTDCKKISIDIQNNIPKGIYTIFSELYGGKLQATKQYTDSKTYDVRVFDVMYINPIEYISLLKMPREQIANWRDNGGQSFFNTEGRSEFCIRFNLEQVPFCGNLYGRDIPTGIEETYDFLQSYRTTHAGINGHSGLAEGVVIRSDDRKEIIKSRFEDYERTLGIRRK